MGSVSRPSLYSHEPQPRPAPLEKYYGAKPARIKILEELKSNHMEGVYNLSFLLLAFALVYLCVRNVVDNGFLAGPSAICFSILVRDLKFLFCFITPLPLSFVVPFMLVWLRSSGRISHKLVVGGHTAALAVHFIMTTTVLFRIALNPLLGVLAGIVVVIFALKMHSYVMTNELMAEETEQRRKSRRGKGHDSGQQTGRISDEQKSQMINDSETSREGEFQRLSVKTEDAKNDKSTSTGTPANDEENIVYATKVGVPPHDPKVKYPRNVTLGNLLYFIVAPILVYETGYPRTEGVRPRYVIWHSFQLLICLVVQYVLLMQFCVPIWRTAAPKDRLWWFSMKLALPCFFMWLLLFWGVFHCALNGIAELTSFADRQFYQEWWNATDLNQFWRTWNIPVHEWCIRHLYVETVSRQKLNRQTAALGTFLLSAVFHEYVCLVGFRMLRPYMFGGMMLQVPLVKWSTRWAGTRTGNCLMWVMLFIGQSWVPLLYCRDYLFYNGTLMCKPL